MCVLVQKKHITCSHAGGVKKHQVISFILFLNFVGTRERESNANVKSNVHATGILRGAHEGTQATAQRTAKHTCQLSLRKKKKQFTSSSWISSWTSSSSWNPSSAIEWILS